MKKLTRAEREKLIVANLDLMHDLRLFPDELDLPSIYESTDEGSRRNSIWITNYIT